MRVAIRRRGHYLSYREPARELIKGRLVYFNQFYGFAFNRIAVKNHRRRLGSCSKKGNLNFNYKIYFLPPELRDYVIVHELCHLGQFNHSKSFWELVARTVPDHKERAREIRKYF